MNLAFCSIFETGSQYVKHKTYDIAVLEGWCEKVTKNKNNLIHIFKQIYADYRETFDKYLNPVTQWSIVMLQTAAITVTDNIKKKKEISKEELTN